MLGRIPGPTCAQGFIDHIGHDPAVHNPGPAGHNDAADPNIAGKHGFTPGPLGQGDYAQTLARRYPQWLLNRRPAPPPVKEEPTIDLAKLHDQLRLQTGVGKITVHEDVVKAIEAARGLVRSFDELPEAKKRGLIDMVFTLGKTAVADLKDLLAAVNERDFNRAAEEMQNSIWFVQVGKRGQELVEAMRMPPEAPRLEHEPLPTTPLFKRRAPTPVPLTPVKPDHGFGSIISKEGTAAYLVTSSTRKGIFSNA